MSASERELSRRPELVVDDHGRRLYDAATQSCVGLPGPFGRERLAQALPTLRMLAARVTEDTRGL